MSLLTSEKLNSGSLPVTLLLRGCGFWYNAFELLRNLNIRSLSNCSSNQYTLLSEILQVRCRVPRRTMKKDRKYFIENLTCFVTRVRSSGGAESIRSFAVSKPTPLPPAGGPTPMNTMASSFYMPSSHSSLHSKASSESGSSLRGSSISSGTFTNQDFKEHHERLGISPLTKQNSMASTTSNSTSSQSLGFDTQSSCDDLFSINHEAISERDASLWAMTPDHSNAGGFGVPFSRRDIPRNSIPRPQLHPARATPPQIDDTLKMSRSGSASPHISKRKQGLYQFYRLSLFFVDEDDSARIVFCFSRFYSLHLNLSFSSIDPALTVDCSNRNPFRSSDAAIEALGLNPTFFPYSIFLLAVTVRWVFFFWVCFGEVRNSSEAGISSANNQSLFWIEAGFTGFWVESDLNRLRAMQVHEMAARARPPESSGEWILELQQKP